MSLSPALHVAKYGPTKPSQVEVGGYYLVKGTNSFGEAIPAQLLRIETPPQSTLIARYSMTVGATVWCLMPEMMGIWSYHQWNYPLGAVNVTDHGVHDRHLERIDPDDWQKARNNGYFDLLRAVHAPPVVTA